MSKWLSNALGIVSICAVCLIGWTAWRIGVLADSIKIPDLTQTTNKFNATLDNVNQPCGGGHPCGLLSNVDKTVTKVGDAIVTTQLTERNTAPHVVAAMDTFRESAVHLSGTADALTGTANGATQTLAVASGDLKTLDTSLQAFPPLLQAANKTINDFDFYATDPHVKAFVANLESLSNNAVALTGNINGIAEDGRRATDKLTNDFVAPRPWWKKIGPSLSDLWDYGALVARHTP